MARNSQLARAFTLIEVIVVLAIIVIMMAMVYPAYTTISERAKATKDMSNLRQIGLAIQTYLNDSDQILPPSTTWPGTTVTPVLYPKYVGTRKVFLSPFDKRPSLETDLAPVSYSINHNMYDPSVGISRNMIKVFSPAATFLMAPNYTGNPTNAGSWAGTATSAPDLPVGGPAETRGTHTNGTRINVLFCDGHTESHDIRPSGHGRHISEYNARSVPLGSDAIKRRISRAVLGLNGHNYPLLIGTGPLEQLGEHVGKYLTAQNMRDCHGQ